MGRREILEPETLRVSVHFSSEKAHGFLQILKWMSQKSMKVSLYQLTPKTSPSCTNQELCLSCFVPGAGRLLRYLFALGTDVCFYRIWLL